MVGQPSPTSREPPKKDDSKCRNCVGVNFYSDKLRAAGKKPRCFGFEYESTTPASEEQMKELERLPPIAPNISCYLIGLSQSTFRMNRVGQCPFLLFGLQVDTVPKGSTREDKISRPASRSDQGGDAPQAASPILPQVASPASRGVVLEQMNRLGTSTRKVLTKGWERAQTASLVPTAESLDRLVKSSGRLWVTLQRVVARAGENIQKRIFGGDDTPKK